MTRRFVGLLRIVIAAIAVSATPSLAEQHMLVYIGTYTGPQSRGIHRCELNTTTGSLTPLDVTEGDTGGVVNPSFLALHPTQPLLFAVSEVSKFGDAPAGGVAAFQIDASGRLKPLNTQNSGGTGPCFLSVDPTGTHVLVANYGGGSVAALPIDPTGRLQPARTFIQFHGDAKPHAHAISADPTGRFAIATDLGLDQIRVFAYNPASGELVANDPPFVPLPAGTGPRHFVFHPNGKWCYVINELNSTIDAFAWNAQAGTLTPFDHLATIPPDFHERNDTAHIAVHPSGRWLYGSNRGHDSIAVFRIDPDTGELTAIRYEPARGRTPRHFNIDPTGTFLLAANQKSDNVQVFRIDAPTGLLTPVGQPVPIPSPVCVIFRERR
ncbi:MAG: lactonase family protein [Phycisphaeraceae bacterium]